MNWKCGKCDKIYTADDLFKKKKVPVKVGQVEKYGYHSVCECGYTFHKDKWRVQDDLMDNQGHISTVFLELDHSFNNDGTEQGGLWYETIVFDDKQDEVECYRYRTKTEAIAGHAKCLDYYNRPRAIMKLIRKVAKLTRR